MKTLYQYFVLILLFLILYSCSTEKILLDKKILDDKKYIHFCGTFDDDGNFYKTGFRLGELPLIIDFEKIEIDNHSKIIKLVGDIQDYETREKMAGELIIADITYQDSSKIYYSTKLKSNIDSTGHFDITTKYNPMDIIIVKQIGYIVTYYDLSEMINSYQY